MNSDYAKLTLAEIERQIGEINSFHLDEKQNSYFAKYLVVFICGCCEAVIESIICEYVDKHRDVKISKYVSESISAGFRNPDTDKIIALLEKFDETWGEAIKLMPGVNKKGMDSIIANKNGLAHSGYSTITMNQIIDLYTRAKPIIIKIDSIVLA
jgi:hypothetical protein